jgi:hypothetical protein
MSWLTDHVYVFTFYDESLGCAINTILSCNTRQGILSHDYRSGYVIGSGAAGKCCGRVLGACEYASESATKQNKGAKQNKARKF